MNWSHALSRKFQAACLLTATFLVFLPSANAGQAYLILDAKSGKILASENADALNQPASLTKMMTLYLTFEALHHGRLGWKTKIPFSHHAATRPPTKLWVPAGSSVTVREAVLGMIVPSANDAAAAMAEKLAGSEDAFSKVMMAKARQLGMKRTVFANASGLPNRKQVTTARDMSTLAVALMNDFPKEYKLFSTRSFRFRGRTVRGHNNLMYRYKGMDGLKTGFTNASGFNLVSAVKRGDRRLIGVVLGGRTARSRDSRMAALLDQYIRKGSRVMSSSLLASVHPTGQILAAFANPPIPMPAPLEMRAESQTASSSKAVADVITATSFLSSKNERTWQIQVGVSESEESATALLVQLRSKYKNVLADLDAVTEPTMLAGKTVCRARFAGFENGAAARSACKLLSKDHIECFAIAVRG